MCIIFYSLNVRLIVDLHGQYWSSSCNSIFWLVAGMAAKYCFLEKYTQKYLPLGRHLRASAYSAYCHRVSIVLQVCPRHTKLKSNLLTFAYLSMAGRFLPTQSYRPMRALSWYEMPWRQGQINLPPIYHFHCFFYLIWTLASSGWIVVSFPPLPSSLPKFLGP